MEYLEGEEEEAYATETKVVCFDGKVCIQSLDSNDNPTGEVLCIVGGQGARVTLNAPPILFNPKLLD